MTERKNIFINEKENIFINEKKNISNDKNYSCHEVNF